MRMCLIMGVDRCYAERIFAGKRGQVITKTLFRNDRNISDTVLIDQLVQKVMQWQVTPDRFIMSGRSWMPRWRFQPLNNLENAFELLQMAATSFTLATSPDGDFTARVQVGDRIGIAAGEPKAAVITVAVARAIGIHIPKNTVPPLPLTKSANGSKGRPAGCKSL